MKPFIKVGHRNGKVFVRIVYLQRKLRRSTMLAITPSEAKVFAMDVLECSARASGKNRKLKIA